MKIEARLIAECFINEYPVKPLPEVVGKEYIVMLKLRISFVKSPVKAYCGA